MSARRSQPASVPAQPANPFKKELPSFDTLERFATDRLIFALTNIEYQSAAEAAKMGSQYGARWLCRVVVEGSGEVAILTLKSNEKRDEEMHAADEYLAKVGPIERLRVRQGKGQNGQQGAYYFNAVGEDAP